MQAENDKTERVTGLGRRTREEIAKWNQMTALRFHTGGDIRHPRPPFGGIKDRLAAIFPSNFGFFMFESHENMVVGMAIFFVGQPVGHQYKQG